MKKYIVLILVLIFSHSAFAKNKLVTACDGAFYRLSTDAYVDYELEGNTSFEGAIAEQLCAKKGMRLPSADELRQMYIEKEEICEYYGSNQRSCFVGKNEDSSGWAYWAARQIKNPDGNDYGYRIIFSDGSKEYIEVIEEIPTIEMKEGMSTSEYIDALLNTTPPKTKEQNKPETIKRLVKKGEGQLTEFWLDSGKKAYVRCVCDLGYVKDKH